MVNKKSQESSLQTKTLRQHAPFYHDILSIYEGYSKNVDGTPDPTIKLFFALVSQLTNSMKYLNEIGSIEIFNVCKNAKDVHDRITLDDKRIDQVNKETWLIELKKMQTIIIKLKEIEFKDKDDVKKIFSIKK